MDRMGAITGMLIVISFAGPGLPAGVQAQGDDDGLVTSDLWRKRS